MTAIASLTRHADVSAAFVRGGWSKAGSGADVRVYKDIGDRFLVLSLRLSQLPQQIVLKPNAALATGLFDDAMKAISQESKRQVLHPIPLMGQAPFPSRMRFDTLQESAIPQISEALVSAARSIDLDVAYARLCALPTDSPGTLPLAHLSALAMAGDDRTLGSYVESFEAGDRLGFVPYITGAMVRAALQFARR